MQCRRWRIVATLLLVLAGAPALAVSANGDDEDAFLRGALSYFLEHDLGWERGSYQLQVHDRLATVTLPEGDDARRTQLERHQPALDRLRGVNIVLTATATPQDDLTAPIYSFLGLARGSVPFPVGDLFLPLLADPKQPQFFTSYRYYDTPENGAHAAAVGYGETFGFYRLSGQRPGDGLQFSVAGALFAQFNLDAPSADLINADYTIGIPVTWRNGSTSARIRLYHQSSHLGDEYLLRARPDRVNLSFESVETIISEQRDPWRFYFGGEYLFHREPSDLKPGALHGGVEWRFTREVWGTGHWVGGIDVKSWEEHNWSPDVSIKTGLEFGAYQPGQRRFRLMLEGYRGYAPHGQFYSDYMTYYGVGLYLGF